MKKTGVLLLVGSLIGLFSCSTSDETSNQRIQKDTLVVVVDTLSNYSESFRNIIKTTDGTFRGVDLGFNAARIVSLEDTSLKENEPGQLEYMLNFNEFENAEVNYILNKENKVLSMEVNIYPKSKASQDSLYSEFNRYFSRRYSKSILEEANSSKWENSPADLVIVMIKRDTQKIHDINITFSSISGQSALYK